MISNERLWELIMNLEDAINFRLKTHEKIVPMGAGEIAQIITALREIAASRDLGEAATRQAIETAKKP